MDVAIPNKTRGSALAAAVFAPVALEDFYEAVLDVRGFPAWAPGVRRVSVLSGEGGAGMLSEWEVSFLGFGKRVLSELQEAEAPSRLRWTYEGPVEGWGECSIERVGGGALASFRSEISPRDPLLALISRGAAAECVARNHLRRSLYQLGRLVAGGDARVLVGGAAPERPPRKAEEGPEGPSSVKTLPGCYSK